MFFDRAQITVKAGRGGDGSMSFRREAHVPKGGPDGGDGGRGGDVVVVCSSSLRDLARFRGRPSYKAGHGRHGEGSRRHGADGDDEILTVPPGTRIEATDGSLTAELVEPGQRVVVARGGGGGRGNKQFATSTQQTPRFAEGGLPGEELELELHLRLLADAGLVGLPNAGKSSLLARMSAARPKIAGYPFTTIDPVLGTIEREDHQLVVVDIPGLIEGAHEGAGLGHEFLAHVERCRLLIHVLDVAPLDESDPAENFKTVENELAAHDERLSRLPRLLALSKVDLIDPETAEQAAAQWRGRLGDRVDEVVLTSAATGKIDDLIDAIFRHVPTEQEPAVRSASGEPLGEIALEHRVYTPARSRGFEVVRLGDGLFKVDGKGIELLAGRFNAGNEEAMRYLESRLRTIGVLRALESAGFESGDEVQIGGEVFELEL